MPRWKCRIACSLAGLLIAAVLAAPVAAENSVVVPDMDVVAGAQGAQIPLLITNAERLSTVVIPVILRSTSGGAFPSALAIKWRERLPADFGAPLQPIMAQNRYDIPGGASCRGDNSGGYQIISFVDTLSHPVVGDSLGLMMYRGQIFGPSLTAGSDSSGSAILLVDVGANVGTFEVDTTCTSVSNHLQFVTTTSVKLRPSFRKGTITVHACDCPHQGDTGPRSTGGDGYINLVDVVTLVSEVFLGGSPAPTDPYCLRSRSDVAPPETCGDGFVDVVDINYLIDYAFMGGPPICDPCTSNGF